MNNLAYREIIYMGQPTNDYISISQIISELVPK